MANRLPSDHQMRVWRLAGRFVCQCREPVRMRIGAFDGWECRGCWRPIIAHHQAVELIGKTLDHCDDA